MASSNGNRSSNGNSLPPQRQTNTQQQQPSTTTTTTNDIVDITTSPTSSTRNTSDNNNQEQQPLDSQWNRQRMERVIQFYARKAKRFWSESQIQELLQGLGSMGPSKTMMPTTNNNNAAAEGEWYKCLINFMRMCFLRSIDGSLNQSDHVRRQSHAALQTLMKHLKDKPVSTTTTTTTTTEGGTAVTSAAATAAATTTPATSSSSRAAATTTTTTTASAAPSSLVGNSNSTASVPPPSLTGDGATATSAIGRGKGRTQPAWVTRNESTSSAGRAASTATSTSVATTATLAGTKRRASEVTTQQREQHPFRNPAGGDDGAGSHHNKRRNVGDPPAAPATSTAALQRATSTSVPAPDRASPQQQQQHSQQQPRRGSSTSDYHRDSNNNHYCGRREQSPSHYRDRTNQDRGYPNPQRRDSFGRAIREQSSSPPRRASSRDERDRSQEPPDWDRKGNSNYRDRDRGYYERERDRDRHHEASERDNHRYQDHRDRGRYYERDNRHQDHRDRHHSLERYERRTSDRSRSASQEPPRNSWHRSSATSQDSNRDRQRQQEPAASSSASSPSNHRTVVAPAVANGNKHTEPSASAPKPKPTNHTKPPSQTLPSNNGANQNSQRNTSTQAPGPTGTAPRQNGRENGGSYMEMSAEGNNKKTASTKEKPAPTASSAPARKSAPAPMSKPKQSRDDSHLHMSNFNALIHSTSKVQVSFLADSGNPPFACYDKKHFPSLRGRTTVTFTPTTILFKTFQTALRRWQRFEPFWQLDWIAAMETTSNVVPAITTSGTFTGKTAAQLNVRLSDPQWSEQGKTALKNFRRWRLDSRKQPSDNETRLLLVALPVKPDPKKRADAHLWPIGTFAQLRTLSNNSCIALKLSQRKQEQHDAKLWKGMSHVCDLTPHVSDPTKPFSIDILSFDGAPFYFMVCLARYRNPEHLFQDLKGDGPDAIAKLKRDAAIEKAVEFAKPAVCLDDEDEAHTEDGAVVFSLKDHSTKRLIETPVRGTDCKHFQCFDLLPFLRGSAFPCGSRFRCGVCEKFISPSDLVVCGLTADLTNEFRTRATTANQDRVEFRSDRSYSLLDERSRKYSGRSNNEQEKKPKPSAKKPANDKEIVEID